MPAAYALAHNRRVALFRLVGVVTTDDLRGAICRATADPAFDPRRPALIDMRWTTELAAPDATLRDLLRDSVLAADTRRALVATPDGGGHRSARALAGHADSLGRCLTVFDSVAAAEAWLVPAERPSPRRGAAAEEPTPLRTILVVDDDDAVRAVTTRVLRRHGFAVVEARDGREGCALAEREGLRLALLVTDLAMPGMTGMELAVHLRARHPALRVLLISGYDEAAATTQGIADVGGAYLPKPFEPAALVASVSAMLADADPRDAGGHA